VGTDHPDLIFACVDPNIMRQYTLSPMLPAATLDSTHAAAGHTMQVRLDVCLARLYFSAKEALALWFARVLTEALSPEYPV
jgi:hypothetical protein